MNLYLATLLLAVAASQAKEIRIRTFNEYQVVSVYASTPAQFQALKSLYEEGQMDFWTRPRHQGLTDIMVDPQQAQALLQLIDQHSMAYFVKIQNVQRLVEEERAQNKASGDGKIGWNEYPRWTELEPWIQGLANFSVATVSQIGKSTEGRNLYAVKISTGGEGKKAVLIDANIHAREWISGATATWILNELTTNSEAYEGLLEGVDLYIIPFINIDGYEYAHTNDRMWRKTRSVNAGTSCRGCDPNRNFAFKFGGESTSPDPCSDIYHGPIAFSEPETAAVRDFVLNSEDRGIFFSAYLTFHSYGQTWLLPWGYTQGVYPPDYPEQLDVGTRAIAALRGVHNTQYTVGQGADQLYGVGGASDDWAKDHGIKYTATIEMRDTGRYGFVLPAAQIIPNAEEVWAGVQVYLNQVISEQ